MRVVLARMISSCVTRFQEGVVVVGVGVSAVVAVLAVAVARTSVVPVLFRVFAARSSWRRVVVISSSSSTAISGGCRRARVPMMVTVMVMVVVALMAPLAVGAVMPSRLARAVTFSPLEATTTCGSNQ